MKTIKPKLKIKVTSNGIIVRGIWCMLFLLSPFIFSVVHANTKICCFLNASPFKHPVYLVIDTSSVKPNTLSTKEKHDGWILLFNGKDMSGWRSAGKTTMPEKGWKVENGIIIVESSQGKEAANGGDIVTKKTYSNFDLVFDFKIAKGSNSGVKYFVTESYATKGSAIGLEYQILDDERHPDAKLGKNGDRTASSLYDLIPAIKNKPINPPGSWNTGRVLVKGKHVEHWLNGVKVLEYERGSKEFRALVAESKYKIFPGFGEAQSGHILLQDHGDEVSFKNIKLKNL